MGVIGTVHSKNGDRFVGASAASPESASRCVLAATSPAQHRSDLPSSMDIQ
jgi:hypothetical protein